MIIPYDQERAFGFELSEDGTYFVLTDNEKQSIVINFDEYQRIESIVFPDGVQAVPEWEAGEVRDILIKMTPSDPGTSMDELINLQLGDCGVAVERAKAAIFIAAGVCYGDPTSVSCWSATATAAYMTYRAWVECNP